MARFFIFMKILSLVNAYYQRLDFYYFSIVRALQNSNSFSHLLFTKSLLKVCNDQATTRWSCYFRFFNANFELTWCSLLLYFLVQKFICLEPAKSQWKGNYGGVSLCCFNFLSLEFGENLGLLYSVVHKLFGNLTFYRNLLKTGI